MSLIDEIYFENQRELEESRKNPKKLTNFEKIKQMSVDEIVETLYKTVNNQKEHQIACTICCNNKCTAYNKHSCMRKIKQWLENEVSE